MATVPLRTRLARAPMSTKITAAPFGSGPSLPSGNANTLTRVHRRYDFMGEVGRDERTKYLDVKGVWGV